ncbi:hypothetical protein D3C87_1541900 [compost metagenome]
MAKTAGRQPAHRAGEGWRSARGCRAGRSWRPAWCRGPADLRNPAGGVGRPAACPPSAGAVCAGPSRRCLRCAAASAARRRWLPAPCRARLRPPSARRRAAPLAGPAYCPRPGGNWQTAPGRPAIRIQAGARGRTATLPAPGRGQFPRTGFLAAWGWRRSGTSGWRQGPGWRRAACREIPRGQTRPGRPLASD